MSGNLSYSREFIELLAENLQAMVAYVDRDQRYVFTNAMYVEGIGLTPSEVVGKRVKDVLGEANYKVICDKLSDALAGKKVCYEREIPLGDADILHFHATYLPHYDEQGEVLGCFVLIQDVAKSCDTKVKLEKTRIHLGMIADARTTQLLQTVRKVETEKIKSDAIIAAMGDHISIQDRDFKILYQNDVLKSASGDHKGAFCYRAYAFGGLGNICQDCPLEKSFQDGKIHTAEKTSKDKPGVTYEITSSPIRDDKGNIIACIEMARDITEQKQRKKALSKANLELEQILDAVEHGIAVIDKDMNIIRANRAMLAMSHLTEEEVVGRKCHAIFQATACHTASCPLQRIMAGEPVVSIECERQRLDGSRFPCEATAKPLLDTEGNLIGLVEDVQDLTEKKKLETEAELLLQQAIQSDKLASLGTVVAGVAHEINNPNSFISYNTPMAEKIWQGVKPVLDEYAARNPHWRVGPFSYPEVTESMAETLQFIKTGSERINTIVTNLKDFAGRDHDKNDSHIQINEIITLAYTIIGAQLRKNVGTIALNLGADLPCIYGQFQRLEQVVINLMLNAMDAIDDKKTGRITVTTKYNDRLQAVLITVEDNGRGMKKDVLDLIFDPFFTTRRDQGGTGLGLSISFGLIKEHNGTLSVLSRPGQGSRFTIYLPLDKRIQKKVAFSPTILCIDDDKQILYLIETFFKKATEAFTITTRDNPEQILSYLDEHPEVDLVISDVMMPNMNGWDLLAQIKNKFPLMPVVLISGDPAALEQPAGAPTADHIIQKPLGLKEIKGLIQNIDRRII